MKQNKIPRNEYIRKPVGKTNPYKGDTIYTDMGQWKYPGQVTKIPSGDITMQGVPYPVYGEDNLGYSQMMYPGMNYQFPGQYVTEYPMAQEGFENQEDPIAHLKWGKYIDDPNRRKQHIVDVYQYLMDSRWDPKNIVSFMKNVGGYGSKSRGSLAKSGADWGWDNEDITNEVLGEAWDDYYNKVRKIKSKQAYGGDPSLPNIEGHYKTGGWLEQYQDAGQLRAATTYQGAIQNPVQKEKKEAKRLKEIDDKLKTSDKPFVMYDGALYNNPYADPERNEFMMMDKTGSYVSSGVIPFDIMLPVQATAGVKAGKASKALVDLNKRKTLPAKTAASKPQFKSDINWEAWNKEIPTNKALMDEYHAIEETTKANGTWMKNPDGSAFKGTPEQFVQQNSENFKKAFPNPVLDEAGNIQLNYHGTPYKLKDDVFKEHLAEGKLYGHGLYTTPKKDYALSYAKKRNNNSPDQTIYELYQNANKKQELTSVMEKADERLKNFLKENPKGSKDFNKKFDAFIKQEDNLFEKYYDPNDFKLKQGFDYFKPNDLEQVVPYSNYPKSAIGNNGMFDMSNPNIYKGIVPLGVGLFGAKALEQQKEGGWLDAYDDEYRRGGQRRKKRGTSKNIQSSINDVFKRNYDVFGPAGKNYFNPRYMAEGGSTEEELEILEPGIDPKTGVPIKSKKEQYQDKIKNNYQSYLESVNNITPYTPVTKEGHMNCIHGVCTVIEGTGAKKFTQEYTGNMTFSDARNKEGFYEVDPTKEGFEIGDIIQYSRKKANAATMGRFKPSSTLTPVNKDDLIPQHAKVILDKYVDDDGITRYVVGHNGGEDTFFITPDSDNGDVKEETLLKHFKEGYNTYDGLIINRYDPDVVEKKEGEKKAEIDTIKGKNSYAHMYNNTPKISIKKEIYDTDLNKKVIEDSGPAKELLEYYKKNYKELGKTADMPPYLLNQLFHNQIGIAEQESKSGEDLGAKQYVPESLTPTFRKLKESISPNDDDWVKDYWAKNVNNVRSTYKSIDNFKNYLNQDKKLSKEAREYLYYNSPKSKGMFQQKELSKRGRILGSNFDTPEKQFLSSMYLAIDNYHLLKNKYPDLSESELVDLTTLMHNSPGKALTKEYVDYYLKNNDIDYVNKVKEKRGILEQPSNKYVEKMQKFNNQKVTTKEIADIKKFLQNIPSKKYGGMLKKYQGDEEGNQVMPDEAIPGVNYFSLPEVTVKPKTMLERIQESDFIKQIVNRLDKSTGGKDWYKDPSKGIGSALAEVVTLPFAAPQLAATYGITGKVQTPSEAMNIENPYGAFAVDAILDPTNLLGTGLIDDVTKIPGMVGKMGKGLTKRVSKNIEDLGEAALLVKENMKRSPNNPFVKTLSPEKMEELKNIRVAGSTFDDKTVSEISKIESLLKQNIPDETLQKITGFNRQKLEQKLNKAKELEKSRLAFLEDIEDLRPGNRYRNTSRGDQLPDPPSEIVIPNFRPTQGIWQQIPIEDDYGITMRTLSPHDDLRDLNIIRSYDPPSVVPNIYDGTTTGGIDLDFDIYQNPVPSSFTARNITSKIPTETTINTRGYEPLINSLSKKDISNPAAPMREALKKILASPKGSKFTPSTSLSTDSYNMSLRGLPMLLDKKAVDVNFLGYNNINPLGYLTKAGQSPNIIVDEMNTVIKGLNKKLPRKQRIPYAMIKDNNVYYPGIGVVRKKMGGWLDKYNNF
jgi:hypothetical protein